MDDLQGWKVNVVTQTGSSFDLGTASRMLMRTIMAGLVGRTIPSGDGNYYHHEGIYAFRRASLRKFVSLPQAGLEQTERLEQRALAIKEKTLGPDHPSLAYTLISLAYASNAQGKHAEAEGFLKRALAIREKALGASHADTAAVLDNLARVSGNSGNAEGALAYSRRATAAIIAHAAAETTGAQREEEEDAGGIVEQHAGYFLRHVAVLDSVAQKGSERLPALAREGFEIAQWASQSAAAAAVQQMSLRFASGSDALAKVVRERQDLSAVWRDRDKALIEALAKPEGQRSTPLIELTGTAGPVGQRSVWWKKSSTACVGAGPEGAD